METEGDCHSKAALATPTEDDDRDSHADLVSICGVLGGVMEACLSLVMVCPLLPVQVWRPVPKDGVDDEQLLMYLTAAR